MNIESVDSAQLSATPGRFVGVQGMQRPKYSHQLVAQNVQEYNKVMVYNVKYNGDKKCMAFGFETENKPVFPVVTHNQQDCKTLLKVLPAEKPTDETFLFQWGEPKISGDWGSLESVANPKIYLCVEKTGKVSVTEQQISHFRIQYSANAAKHSQEGCSASVRSQVIEINPCRKIPSRRCNLKRGSSCCEGSVTSHKPQRCSNRKTKKMKM